EGQPHSRTTVRATGAGAGGVRPVRRGRGPGRRGQKAPPRRAPRPRLSGGPATPHPGFPGAGGTTAHPAVATRAALAGPRSVPGLVVPAADPPALYRGGAAVPGGLPGQPPGRARPPLHGSLPGRPRRGPGGGREGPGLRRSDGRPAARTAPPRPHLASEAARQSARRDREATALVLRKVGYAPHRAEPG